MKNKILESLSIIKGKITIKSIHIESLMNYYRLFFMDLDSNYYCLEVFYNDTDVFGLKSHRDNDLIGVVDDESFSSTVLDSIVKFDSYEECNKKSESVIHQFQIDKFLGDYSNALIDRILSLHVEGLTIKDVKIFMRPSLMISIFYELSGVPKGSLKFFIGEEKSEDSNDSRVNDLICQVNELTKGGRLIGS